jgi:hypothetical protein
MGVAPTRVHPTMYRKMFLFFRGRHLLKRKIRVGYLTPNAFNKRFITSFRRKRRHFSTSSQSTLVYVGPLRKAIKLLKLFSITTATLTLTLTPILVLYGNPNKPLAARLGVSMIVFTMGISTTLLLHWFMKGYVVRMYVNKDLITVVTYNIFGREKSVKFLLSEARPPSRVATLSTFQAKNETYFLHTEIFQDVELLHKLGGPLTTIANDQL